MLAASAVCFAAPKVEIVTSEGNIVVNLNEKAAPTTVANFVKYAKEGFYNGTIFHRVINNFMIQGGGFDRNLHQKSTHAPIKLEDKNGLKTPSVPLQWPVRTILILLPASSSST